jgi:4-amino-4-deoxy-L-arabinose transferase-like glycosyltransferase
MSSPAHSTRPAAGADANPAGSAADSRWRLYFAGVLAAAAALFFARLGTRALWSSEFRWAEIAREMILSHNYFWPTINGRVYFDKPLGSYWLVVASTYLTGAMNEAAARIPCAVAGVLGVAFMMLLARRLYDSRTALLAGVVLATSFSFVFFSRTASADVATVTGELAALLLFLRNENRRGGWWVIGLWLIMAATSQMKGLLGFALPIAVIGVYCPFANGWNELRERFLRGPVGTRVRWFVDRNGWFFNWTTVIAIAIGFTVYYAPFAISDRIEGSEKGIAMVIRENVVRYFHPFDHRGPIYLYVYVIFAIMAPWAMLLPAALVEAHNRRRLDIPGGRADRFALAYFWATFIFFTLSGSRRSYYILPLVPAGALLVARLLVGGEIRSILARRMLAVGYGLTAAAAVLGIALLLPAHMLLPGRLGALPPLPDRAVFVPLWLVCAAGVVYALRDYRPARIAVSMGLIAYFALAYIYVFAMPAADAYREEKPFALATLKLLGGDTSKLVLYRTEEGLFYLNPPHPLPQFARPAELEDAVQSGAAKWIIVRRRDLPSLDFPVKQELVEPVFPWDSAEHTRNKVVLLRVDGESRARR